MVRWQHKPRVHGIGASSMRAQGSGFGAYAPVLARGNLGPGIDERTVGQGAEHDREGHAGAGQQPGARCSPPVEPLFGGDAGAFRARYRPARGQRSRYP